MIQKTSTLVPQPKEHLSWSASYSMGIKMIDDQHKGLLNLVNQLFNHSAENEAEEMIYFKEVIHQVVEYVKYHFQAEEKLMTATKFSGYAVHKKVHDAFTLEIIKSVKDFEAGKRLVLEKYAYYLKDWILTHIAVMDMQYAAYFRTIATRKADGRLTITKEDVEK